MLVYVGSFIQATLHARGLSTPLVQAVDGKELYTGVLIAPASDKRDQKAIPRRAGREASACSGALPMRGEFSHENG